MNDLIEQIIKDMDMYDEETIVCSLWERTLSGDICIDYKIGTDQNFVFSQNQYIKAETLYGLFQRICTLK